MTAGLEPSTHLSMQHEQDGALDRIQDDRARGQVRRGAGAPDAIGMSVEMIQEGVTQLCLGRGGRIPGAQLIRGIGVEAHR